MVTNQQVKKLFSLVHTEETISRAAMKAGMDKKTAQKYRRAGRLPIEMKVEHEWRTREDPFVEVWDEVKKLLEVNPGFEAKTIFEYLQRKYIGRFNDGQLRTLQRRVKIWRALEGSGKEVFFPQKHHPGILCQSDFTDMSNLGVTIGGQPFQHLIYHFVLTYSNWEAGTICFSENFESLSEGLQNAIWELGGVPKVHQTDRLSAAVNNLSERDEFANRYQALLRYYNLEGRKTGAKKPHESGDIEQRHHRFKRALEQALFLRGRMDFDSREEYEEFLSNLFTQLNAGRRKRLCEEIEVLRELPDARLDTCKRFKVKVGPSSTIHVRHNTYSVHSRMIGETVEVKLYADHLKVLYAQRCVENLPRLRGEGRHKINYRHIIDWLVRKPGAFENYRYRDDLFPSSHFRMAYDVLKECMPKRGNKEYVRILELAAKESESRVDDALRLLLTQEKEISFEAVKGIVISYQEIPSPKEVFIDEVSLAVYDELLSEEEESNANTAGCEGVSDRLFERAEAQDSAGML